MTAKNASAPIFLDPQGHWLEKVLELIAPGRVAVFGDFCLDAYWHIGNCESELSLETGLPVRRVTTQSYGLGGASNVASNLRSLGLTEVSAIGLVGEDLFGAELISILARQGIRTDGMLKGPQGWQTPVFSKPCLDGEELNRLDFGTTNTFPQERKQALLDMLETAAAQADAVIINQQLPYSIISPAIIPELNALIARHPKVVFIVDSRDHAGQFEGAVLKVNSHEAARLEGHDWPLERFISLEEACTCALALAKRTRQPVFVTRGEHGLLVVENDHVSEVPGIQIVDKIDPVGAGDTVVSVLAAVLGRGGDAQTAAHLANLAASVTVRKIHTTGTVTPDELRACGGHPDFIYRPELADSPRLAQYLPSTEIEIIEKWDNSRPLLHAVFDHDGTLSTQRQGWEKIMEPMMLKAIFGQQIKNISQEVYARVENDVRAFIDKTTGIQTLAQMKGLAELVREYGFVPKEEILDEHGYKAIYNEALLAMVRERIAKMKSGELSPEDFAVKGAHAFLETLHAAGVKLYLASGTDEQDVRDEAEVMGYAHLFEGRIYGAVGDLKVEAKRVVLERILNESGAYGPELLVVGDGPVELREGRKRQARCLGIASDELCRFGLNLTKRKRLIRAGAHIVIPDFSQLPQLKKILGLKEAVPASC